jgi:hypothetical protein
VVPPPIACLTCRERIADKRLLQALLPALPRNRSRRPDDMGRVGGARLGLTATGEGSGVPPPVVANHFTRAEIDALDTRPTAQEMRADLWSFICRLAGV